MKNLTLLSELLDTDKAIARLLTLAPWLTPLSAMQITVENMITRLGFWPPVAWATGLSIEILGMATLHTALTFYQHNRKYRDEKNKMPMGVPIGAFVLYIILIIGIVILLELPIENQSLKDWLSLAVKAMLALLSIPAGLVITARELHKETLHKLARKGKPDAQEQAPASIKIAEEAQTPAQVSETLAQVTEEAQTPAQVYENWKQVPEGVRKEIARLTHWKQVKALFPYVKERSCQDWLKNARALYPQA